ncbi:MAG: hypothetical protein LBN92_00590 [Treponema sp.]|nr:hypothetical protein [Treponema sp.]
MKKRSGFLFMAGMAAVLFGILVSTCDNGTSPSPGNIPNPPVLYGGSVSGGSTYLLAIDGNSYTLTVYESGSITNTSSGTLTANNGGTMTLAPAGAPDVTFSVTVSGNGISSITGTITFVGGGTETAPGTVTPTAPGTITFTITGNLYEITGWNYDIAQNVTPYSGTGSIQQLTGFRIDNIDSKGGSDKPLSGVSGYISADGKLTLTLPVVVSDDSLFDMSAYSPGLKGGGLDSTPNISVVDSTDEADTLLYINRDFIYEGKIYPRGWNWPADGKWIYNTEDW